ncbi:MAG: hypothetical protein AAB448_04325 [Patescibacteria group bacterium]
MALKDFLPPEARKGPDTKKEGSTTPEKRRQGDWFNRVPGEYKKDVEWVAKKNHRYYADRFPSYEEFLDAVAESWIETKRRFEEETRSQGFVPIQPEEKASVLNGQALAFLSAHGSVFLFGPGAFEKKLPGAPGAALSYVKIPLRDNEDLLENTDQRQGVFLESKPGVGKLLEKKGIYSPSRGRGSEDAIFTSTAPVIVAMRRDINHADVLAVLGAAKTGLTRVFEEVHQEAGLALVRPKSGTPEKR